MIKKPFRYIQALFALLFVFSLCSCVQFKLGDQRTEGTSLYDHTEELLSEDAVWPKEYMDNVPELNCEIVKVTSQIVGIVIYFDNMDYEGAEAYVLSLKDSGFTQFASEAFSSVHYSYKAYDSDRNYVSFLWSRNAEGTLNYLSGN